MQNDVLNTRAHHVVSRTMRAPILWGVLVVAAITLSFPDSASAGFGRSSGGRSGGGGRSSGGGGRSSGSRATVHTGGGGSSFGRSSGRVSPRSERDARVPAYGGYQGGRSGGSWGSPRPRPWVWGPGYHVWGYGFAVLPPPTIIVDSPPVEEYPNAPPPTPPVAVAALAGDLTIAGSGPLLGAQLSIEGERLGFVFAYTAALAAIPGTQDFDALHLAQGHLTYALLTGERGRLRAELGAHLAVAPEMTFLAPGGGLSAALGLVGPLGVEARIYGNFWPYTQIDARAGLTLASHSVGFSAGARALYLNDNGRLGEANADDTDDLFFGPYVSLALAL